jgi:hypothetical protein
MKNNKFYNIKLMCFAITTVADNNPSDFLWFNINDILTFKDDLFFKKHLCKKVTLNSKTI